MDDLFPDIPRVEPVNQKVIDDAVKQYTGYQKEYVWCAVQKFSRDAVTKRWDEVKDVSETNFIKEFMSKGNFHSRLWELNCRYSVRNHIKNAPSEGQPDIIADNFVIECVVPKPNDVPEPKYDMVLRDYPELPIARRVTAALTDKLRQLEKRKTNPGKIDYDAVPYIIAVGLPDTGFLDAHGMSGLSIVEEMLMGAGPPQVTVDTVKNTATMSISSRHKITSRSGKEIKVAYFQTDEFKPVSAVITSSEYLPEGNDMEIILNPNANIPLDPALIPELKNVISYTKKSDHYERDQKLE